MKIIYILSGTNLLGGATKSFLNLLNYVVALGHKPIVVTPDRSGIYTVLRERGIETVVLPYYFDSLPGKKMKSRLSAPVKKLLNYWSAIRLKRICATFKPDIIHSNTTVNNIGYLVAKWLNIPHIWHIREYGDKDFNIHIRDIEARLNAPGNYSIAITKDIARHRKVLGKSSNRVIYNGIINHQNRLTIRPKKNYFLYAGRIERTKGIEDCVNAFISLKTEKPNNVRLLIAGEPTAQGATIKTQLIEELESRNLASDVDWLGGVANIGELMEEAIATIIPSYFEGFGRVMPEAMVTGCLVVGRNTGGTKEQFDNGVELTGDEIGLRFDTTADLKKCMEDIIKNGTEYYHEMLKRAFTTVNSLYTIKEYRVRITDFYKEILNR